MIEHAQQVFFKTTVNRLKHQQSLIDNPTTRYPSLGYAKRQRARLPVLQHHFLTSDLLAKLDVADLFRIIDFNVKPQPDKLKLILLTSPHRFKGIYKKAR
ncbi:hypothetical protein L6J37_03545 [Photobacterium sp. WH77]|uniref:Uncharacterized protein n=1 Tax=Photobacterium arenosum TaxID=2774143 RepID=A0ABR9BLV6_9GAMM|nr:MULTISPECIES: hypothetical protein [Photobacterium]MBD8512466.1 hypothetical protein [Photobacterium arenosum]MBV7260826.1 hypothetical protein [Photobacterium sp. WH24]MCG2835936.1 hypothetical protein [Photobacterium sp. WH77]MCG2843387.1 hypothetical protein [Photobacterium sp. WH80]MDO6579976.1 hypothetical protein [Photobacterium sp. 2_MG-2023]